MEAGASGVMYSTVVMIVSVMLPSASVMSWWETDFRVGIFTFLGSKLLIELSHSSIVLHEQLQRFSFPL